MTLTNHIRRIEELAALVIVNADFREYEKAYCNLDDIEVKVHAVHRHLDNLQRVADCAARPTGE